MLFYPPKFDDDGIPVDPATYRFGGRFYLAEADVCAIGPRCQVTGVTTSSGTTLTFWAAYLSLDRLPAEGFVRAAI